MAEKVTSSARARNLVRLSIGTLLSLGFLWLSFRGVDWRSAWERVAHADTALLLAALATVLLTTLLRTARWELMLRPDRRHLRLGRVFMIFLVGQAINAAVPVRLGEVVRAYLVGESEQVSKLHAFWTTIVEKVLDTLVLLIAIAWLSLLILLPAWLGRAAWSLTLALALIVVALVVALLLRDRAGGWLARLEVRYEWLARLRLSRFYGTIVHSLGQVRDPRMMAGLLVWSGMIFLSGALTNWVTARALDLALPFSASLLLLAVLQISAVVPLPTSPGRVGLFHYLCIITLAIFGYERDVALSYALVLHVLTYLPMAIGGPLGIWLQSYWRGSARPLSELLHLGRDDIGDGTAV